MTPSGGQIGIILKPTYETDTLEIISDRVHEITEMNPSIFFVEIFMFNLNV